MCCHGELLTNTTKHTKFNHWLITTTSTSCTHHDTESHETFKMVDEACIILPVGLDKVIQTDCYSPSLVTVNALIDVCDVICHGRPMSTFNLTKFREFEHCVNKPHACRLGIIKVLSLHHTHPVKQHVSWKAWVSACMEPQLNGMGFWERSCLAITLWKGSWMTSHPDLRLGSFFMEQLQRIKCHYQFDRMNMNHMNIWISEDIPNQWQNSTTVSIGT